MAQTLQELMTSGPAVLPGDATLAQAAKVMREQDIGDVLVVKGKQLRGIVTDRDIVVRGIATGADPTLTPLSEVCSSDVVTLAPDDDVQVAIRTMNEHALRRMPVVADGEIAGVVSLGDLAMERDPSSLLGGISAAPANA